MPRHNYQNNRPFHRNNQRGLYENWGEYSPEALNANYNYTKSRLCRIVTKMIMKYQTIKATPEAISELFKIADAIQLFIETENRYREILNPVQPQQ